MKSLIIVESPAKAKTINKIIINNNYLVEACMGHIKELPTRRLGVDIDNDFQPRYIIISSKKHIVRRLKELASGVDEVYLATDPDREGEAISWHLFCELKKSNNTIFRLIFHEITKDAVLDALRLRGSIDTNKVKSQQARRILDRLVGYMISPLLRANLAKGLSAGRVQSVAVRMICEREEEIKKFRPQEYWSITVKLRDKEGRIIEAKLELKDEKKDIPDQDKAQEIIQLIKSYKEFIVEALVKKEKRRNPTPPFTTSKLQQEAANKFNFTAKKTMLLAQQLYEGIELGTEGPVGLITYMRTDSVRVADYAKEKARDFIIKTYGQQYLPIKPPEYKNKGKVQDAHEAIRPTYPEKTQENMKNYLTQDQYKLYKLIWSKFIASQMSPALLEITTYTIKTPDTNFSFKLGGFVIKFLGFMVVYDYEEGEKVVPILKEGEALELVEVIPKQHFTQPPPRYSEASLVKALEENGIGRPSTYAQIIDIIKKRGYVKKERRGGVFIPTDLGVIVNDILIKNFPEIVDINFTAQMEEDLDRVEEGNIEWLKIVRSFYNGFIEVLNKAKENLKHERCKFQMETDIDCVCGHKMVLRQSRFGRFLACSNFPECKEKKQVQIVDGKIIIKEPQFLDEECSECGSRLVLRESRFGQFIACSNYPSCKFKKLDGRKDGEKDTKKENNNI